MVAAAKRMRHLSEKLFYISRGPGSIELSKDASIQLKRIYMRIPTGTWPNREFYWGAREFWRRELERLKYQNPSLIVDVETIRQGEEEPMYLTAEYESSDRQELENLQQEPFPKPLYRITPFNKWETEKAKKKAATEPGAPPKTEQGTPADQLKKIASSLGILKPLTRGQKNVMELEIPALRMMPAISAHAPDSTVVVQSQPAALPSEPQSTSPPTTTYSRTLTLPLAGLRAFDIWDWFRRVQNLPYEGRKPEQNALTAPHQKMVQFKKQAAKDRKMVRAGLLRKKNEAAELEKARAAAERATAQFA